MGFAKRMLEEGPGVQANGCFVCAGCFEDEALKEFIGRRNQDAKCDFCDAQDSPVASFRQVVDHLHASFCLEYSDAANWLPYETAEGGYQGRTFDTWDLVSDYIGLTRDSGKLHASIVERLGDQTWCKANPFALPEAQRLLASWNRFCDLLKHGRRYFFLDHKYDGEKHELDHILGPREILETVTELAEEMGLVVELPAGMRVFRARVLADGTPFLSAQDLGPPPSHLAPANRMSPAGVPLFYCARDSETALAETVSDALPLSVGEFELMRTARMLDLTSMPPVPSLFDEHMAQSRQRIRFLRNFAADVSRPLARGDQVHFEYVPTQVIAEYVRFVFAPGGVHLDGIVYRSAQRKEGVCMALFATQEQLAGTSVRIGTGSASGPTGKSRAPWLRLVGATEHTASEALACRTRTGS